MKSDAELSAIKEELLAKGVNYCIGAYVDIHGVPKGKVVPLAPISRILRAARNSTPAMRWTASKPIAP